MAEQLELPEPSGGAEPSEPSEPEEATSGRDEAALALAARHALHDEELVAGYAADALGVDEPDELARARALVERCAVCRALHADLVTIAAAHRATGALALAAARDFRLSDEDARRLRPGVAVVRAAAAAPGAPVPTATAAAREAAPGPAAGPSFMDRLRAAFGSLTGPLGGVLVAAGLVGILVGSVNLSGMTGASAGLGFDGPEIGVPGPTAGAAGETDDRSTGPAAEPATIDVRIVVIGASIVVVLVGLGLLTSSRRRAVESP